MSVPVPQRDESKMAFLEDSAKIYLKLLSMKKYFPKTYTFTLYNPIVKLAFDLHTCCEMANSIYPKNKSEYELREKYFAKARALAYTIVSKIWIMKEICDIPFTIMDELSYLLNEELSSLNGIMEYDRSTYKSLK